MFQYELTPLLSKHLDESTYSSREEMQEKLPSIVERFLKGDYDELLIPVHNAATIRIKYAKYNKVIILIQYTKQSDIYMDTRVASKNLNEIVEAIKELIYKSL